jgi:hypothetical protein
LVGLCTSPASMAAWGRVRSTAFTLKYFCEAAWMP